MSLVTRNPTSNQTPDPGQGGSAVTGNTNTGHASTTSFATRDTNGTTTQIKTCIWTALQAVSGLITAINLKFTWEIHLSTNANTTAVGDQSDALAQVAIQYSTNGGGAWNNQVVKTVTSSAVDGSTDSDSLDEGPTNETVSIPLSSGGVPQDISQIQIRDSIKAEVTISEVSAADGTGSSDATISNIRVEITLSDGSVMCGM